MGHNNIIIILVMIEHLKEDGWCIRQQKSGDISIVLLC